LHFPFPRVALGDAETERTTQMSSTDSSSAQDRTEGTFDDAKGRVKGAVGNLTGDKQQQGEGMLDQAKGAAKKGMADAKDKLNDMKDKASNH
jgi:uncharacterized protein YjbJ (UPF0337 family)